jgi:primosomal protein N' (replication factor Y)
LSTQTPHRPSGQALKDITEVIDDTPFVPPAVVDLARWVGQYYAAGPGGALALAMPVAARQGEKDSFRTARVAELLPARRPQPSRAAKQRAALAQLQALDGRASLAELKTAGVSAATVASLERAGLLVTNAQVSMRDPFAGGADAGRWTLGPVAVVAPDLTTEQAHAFRQLEEAAASRTFRTVLLHGVTGSGKTEIYLSLARKVIEGGGRVLMLVPRISLTPALAGLCERASGTALPSAQRALGRRAARPMAFDPRGDVDIVIGTRSAVFAPLEQLALVIVDEEHDGSYKQDESPRYHGRDVAVVRARMEGALGGAR